MNARIQQNDEAGINAEFVPPWEKSNAFIEKPADKEYGHYLGGKFAACSREELIAKCKSRDLPLVQLVWCPELPRITPAGEVEFLFEALRDRARHQLRVATFTGALNCCLWGLLACMAGGSNHQVSWMLFLVVFLGVMPAANGLYGLQKLKRATFAKDAQSIKIGRYSNWVLTQKIRFTWLLLVVISIVFAMECVKGFSTSAKLAGLDKSAVWHGEWWRLFTAPLLHGNPVHFLFNALALVGLGRLMEVLASKFYLVLVFAIAALTGSVFSLLLLPGVTSVGASGGLLGLIGFLAVLGIRRKQSLPPGFAKSIAINIALLAMMGIIAFSLIDNAAHLGGLVAGLVLGQWLVSRGDPSIPLQTAPAIKIGGTIALMLVFGFTVFAAVRILTH